MITALCPDGHAYNIHSGVIADLTGGWNAITFCPTCECDGRTVRVYTELTPAHAAELIAHGHPQLTGACLRTEQNRHGRQTRGPVKRRELADLTRVTDTDVHDWIAEGASHA